MMPIRVCRPLVSTEPLTLRGLFPNDMQCSKDNILWQIKH
jgi:hypothetical protein